MQADTDLTWEGRCRFDCDRGLVVTARLLNPGTRESGLVPVEETTADVVICPVPAASPRVHFLTDVVVVTVVRVRQPDLTLRVVAPSAVWFCSELLPIMIMMVWQEMVVTTTTKKKVMMMTVMQQIIALKTK